MRYLYGKPIADKILEDLKNKIKYSRITPGLGVILVGDNEASKIYVNLKEKAARDIGIYFEKINFAENVPMDEVISKIIRLNARRDIHGIIIQLPLPKHLDADALINLIDPKKDADGFHPKTIEKLIYVDRENAAENAPVFPQAIIELLLASGVDLPCKEAALIVNSQRFGKVLSAALKFFGARSEIVLAADLGSRKNTLRNADIIVTACGLPKLIIADQIKDGAIIIDGGISKIDGKIVGDIDEESVKHKAAFLSPVPGGVGPLTVACLLRMTAMLAWSGNRNI